MPIYLLDRCVLFYIFNELRPLGRQYLYMGLMAASAELASIQHLRRVIWQLPTQIANDFWLVFGWPSQQTKKNLLILILDE